MDALYLNPDNTSTLRMAGGTYLIVQEGNQEEDDAGNAILR